MAKKKFDDLELIECLHLCEGNKSKAARTLGVTKAAINHRVNKLPEGLLVKDVDTFRKKRMDAIVKLQQIFMQHITPEKLKKASLSQLMVGLGILLTKEQELQSSGAEHRINVAHVHALHPKDKDLLAKFIKQTTTRKIEESIKSHNI